MPLVWELTDELKHWLTPDKLRELNAGWRMQGIAYPDVVIEDFASVLVRDAMHYESLWATSKRNRGDSCRCYSHITDFTRGWSRWCITSSGCGTL